MSKVRKTLTFDADLEGLIDAGNSSNIAIEWSSSGNPGGSLAFHSTGVATGTEYAHRGFPQTAGKWTDFGVPAGGVVTAIEIVSYDLQTEVSGGVAQATSYQIRIIDDTNFPSASVTILDPVSSFLVHSPLSAWATLLGQGVISVIAGKQASDTNVRFQFQALITTFGSPTLHSSYLRFDNVILEITYTDPPAPDDDGDGDTDTGSGGAEHGGEIGECTPTLDPNIIGTLAANQSGAVAWYFDNCIYLSMGRRTYIYDSRTNGWSDSRYGNITWGAVNQIPGHEELMWMLMPGVQGGNSGNFLSVTSKMFRPGTPNTLSDVPRAGTPTSLASDKRSVILGPYDGKGPDRERVKRAVRLTVWGDYEVPADLAANAAQIGTVTMYAEGGYSETYPIIPFRRAGYTGSDPPRNVYEGEIVWQKFTMAMRSRVLWAKLTFTVPCVSIRDSMLEYVNLESER